MPEAAIGGNTGNIRNTCACKFCEIIKNTFFYRATLDDYY